MLVVNLYAGPCAGKSTLAGDVFTRLKRAGIQAEIPPEVAKIRSQRGDVVYLQDQIAVFGQTQHQLNMTQRCGAEVAVVDSPLMLSLIYMPRPYFAAFPALVREVHDQFENLNYLLKRDPSHGYSLVGRVHNEQEALCLDQDIRTMLAAQDLAYRLTDSSAASAERIAEDVISHLQARNEPATRRSPSGLKCA